MQKTATHDAFCRGHGLYAPIKPSNMFRIDDPDDNRRPDIEIRGLPTKLLENDTIGSPLHSKLKIAQSEVRRRTTARAVIRKNNKYHSTVKAAEHNFVPMAFELWFLVKGIHGFLPRGNQTT